MKKIIFALFALVGVLTASANTPSDTTITTLNDIINMESETKTNNDNSARLRDIWNQNTYLNIRECIGVGICTGIYNCNGSFLGCKYLSGYILDIIEHGCNCFRI